MSNLNRDNVYYGFGGEHYIISQFYSMKYEATKMEVDFGFDLLLTNQYRYSKGMDSVLNTFAIQVKTATIYEKNIREVDVEGYGAVRYARKDFYVSKNDLDLISRMKNGYLICMFVKNSNESYNPIGLFWLNSKHLLDAKEKQYIKLEEHSKYGLCYCIKTEISINNTLNHLTEYCLARMTQTFGESELVKDLKDLLNHSNVIPHRPLTAIRLVIEDNSTSYGNIRDELRDLRKLTTNFEYELMLYDEEDYQKQREESNPTIEDISLKKFMYELENGFYD